MFLLCKCVTSGKSYECNSFYLRGNYYTEYFSSTQKNPDDVVITLALRTPLAKASKGGFKDTDLDYMVFALLKEVVARSKLDPALIEDVCLGNVHLPTHIRAIGNLLN